MSIFIILMVVASIAFASGAIKIKSRELTVEQDPQTGDYYYVSKSIDNFDTYGMERKHAENKQRINVSKDEATIDEIDDAERAESNALRIFGNYSEDLQKAMAKLELVARSHEAELPAEYDLTDKIFSLYKSVKDLFDRLENMSHPEEFEVLYTMSITKLTVILGETYYMNIVLNKNHWEDRDERITKVQSILQSTIDKASGDIKKVNASNDIEMNVIMQSLKNNEPENVIEDIFINKNDKKQAN